MAANANGPLTVVWDDGPGHGRGVDSSNHPEHAQPTQMLSSLLSGQHLRKVGEHDGDRSADPANTVGCDWFRTSSFVLSACATGNVCKYLQNRFEEAESHLGEKKTHWVAHEQFNTSSTSSKQVNTRWRSGLLIRISHFYLSNSPGKFCILLQDQCS